MNIWSCGLLLVWLVALAHPAQCQSPFIVNHSPSAVPGEIINIQGEYFGSSPQVLVTLGDVQLPAVILNNFQKRILNALIPTTLDFGIYSVQVKNTNTNKLSAPSYINAAIIRHVDVLEIGSGDAISIFGLNLFFSRQFLNTTLDGTSPQPTATLTADNTDSISLLWDASKVSDSEAVYFTVPQTAVISQNKTYNLIFDNGLGRPAYAPNQLIGIARSSDVTDVFNLTLNMGKDFSNLTANIVTLSPSGSDDTKQIQDAIDAASVAGGGVVKLTAGQFVTQKELSLKDNVVLQGAGPSETTITWQKTASYWTLTFCTRCGFADFTMNYPLADSNAQILIKAQKFFIARCHFNVGAMTFVYITDGWQNAMVDSVFTQGPDATTYFIYTHHKYFTMLRTRHTFGSQLISMINNEHVVVRDSVIQRNSTAQKYETFHNLSLQNSKFVTLLNNRFEVIPEGTRPYWVNSGETILAEAGPDQGDRYAGQVVSVSADGLTLQFNNPKPFQTPFLTAPSVAIVRGTGLGQVRNIVSNTENSFTVDKAWDIVPDTTSVASLLPVCTENWLLKDNVMIGNTYGIALYYCGVFNLTIVGNHLINNNGIWFAPYLADNHQGVTRDYGPILTWQYQVQIRNNLVYSNDTTVYDSGIPGLTSSASGAFISTVSIQNGINETLGVLTMGIEIKQNVIIADRPQMPKFCFDYQFRANDGVAVFQNSYGQSAYPSENSTSLVGTIVQDNTIANIQNSFVIGTGASTTTMACNRTPGGDSNVISCSFPFDSAADQQISAEATVNLHGDTCPVKRVSFPSTPASQSNSPSGFTVVPAVVSQAPHVNNYLWTFVVLVSTILVTF